MAIVTAATRAIPEAQIKVRWREPYASEGVNTALGALDPGCYRGGYLKATSPASTLVQITPDGEADSAWVWQDLATGVALVVRYPAAVTIDLTSRFTGGGSTMPTTTSFYVYLNCTYSTGTTTAANFYVDDAAFPGGNAIPIARIVVPGGAATILDTYIHRGAAADRQVVALDRVALKHTSATFTPSGTPLAFQITGKVYWPGGTAAAWYKDQFVRLMGALSVVRTPIPYLGADTGVIKVSNVWGNAAGTTPLVADSEGFVTDPYVVLDVTHTTDTSPGAGRAWYWTRSTARAVIADDDHTAAFDAYPHADEIFTTDVDVLSVSEDPTGIWGSTVADAITTLVRAVNERMKTISYITTPAAPVLLFRSHGIAADANVMGTTVSLYWGTTLGFAIVSGGYLTATNFVEAPVAPATVASMIRVTSNAQIGAGLFTKRTGFTSLAWNTLSAWDNYVRNGDLLSTRLWDVLGILTLNSGAILAGATSTLGLTDQDNFIWGNLPGTGTDTYCHLFKSAALTTTSATKLHIYYAAAGSLVISSNAYWDEATTAWYAENPAVDAWLVVFNAVGFGFYRKDHANFGIGSWYDAPATPTWDTVMLWGSELANRLAAFPAMVGLYYDLAKVAMGAVSGATGFQRGYSAVTWHAALAAGTGLTVTATADDCYPSAGSWTITTIPDVVGCLVEGVTTASVAEGVFYYWEGTIYAHS
jgi:hypothetical protein